jgi:hypothetical protein
VEVRVLSAAPISNIFVNYIIKIMELLTQIVGWLGTFLIVLAYFLVSSKKVNSSSKVYQFLNLGGAVALGINVFVQSAWPALGLQLVWGIIAISSLIKSNKSQAPK